MVPKTFFPHTSRNPKTPKTINQPTTMSSFAAARSVLRSSAARATVASRLASAPRPKPASSPFRVPKPTQSLSAPRIFRSPVELGCCVETMLPYHTATASALLTSMLSVSQRSYGWTPEGQDKTR